MKYYYKEHLLGYEQIRREAKTSWAEIHGHTGFENFSSREFLEEILPKLRFSVTNPEVLVCGCGTGPDACFLAERGFRVDGIDLILAAIEIAREQATERGLDIDYQVLDVCEIPHQGKKYDMIIDSCCLQCIVFEEDRQRVFSAVRARLKPEGYYLISTAMYDEPRLRQDTPVRDPETGTVYNVYVYEGEDADEIIDAKTGIVLRKLEEKSDDDGDALKIGESWYLPVRRHRKAGELRRELEVAGFNVLYQDEILGGNVLCILRESPNDQETGLSH